MIIVSQNKEEIVNFDNIMFIEIAADDKTIRCQFKDLNLWLGHYETIERAKEVFEEIMTFLIGHLDCYEMPEK